MPRTRSRGVKALGLRYERLVGRALGAWPGLRLGPWFEFCDANGRGYCQADALIIQPDLVVVLECKLTDVPQADLQLEGLYKPVLEHIYKRRVHGVVVTRHLTRTTDLSRVTDSFAGALARPRPILHWLGRGPI
jgi:hypothetical protein